MPAGWAAGAAAVAGVVGASMQSDAAKSAANTSADAQRYAADQAAAAAKFNPIGITTRFGQSNFTRSNDPTQDFNTWATSQGYNLGATTDAEGNTIPSSLTPDQLAALQTRYQAEVPRTQGDVTAMGYTLSPELKAIQDKIMGQASAYDVSPYAQASQNVFNLGQSYLAKSPEAAAADWLNLQRGLLAPGREQQQSTLQNQVFQSGRSGLGVGGTRSGYGAGQPGLMQTNPEMAAYYNAMAQQDAALASQADQYGQARATYGLNLMNAAPGLFNAGYAPLQTQLGIASTMEQLGQAPLDISAQMAGRTATAGANAGQFLLSGGLNAARTQQLGNQQSFGGSALTGVSQSLNTAAAPAMQNWFNSLINKSPTYGGTPQGGYATQDTYLQSAYANPQTQQQQMLAAQMEGF